MLIKQKPATRNDSTESFDPEFMAEGLMAEALVKVPKQVTCKAGIRHRAVIPSFHGKSEYTK